MKNGRQTVELKDGTLIAFGDGAHAAASFVAQHLGPYFVDGTIPPFPGADYYAVCYGELYAYTEARNEHGHHVYIAVWSAGVPDCEHDVVPGDTYAGEWVPVRS